MTPKDLDGPIPEAAMFLTPGFRGARFLGLGMYFSLDPSLSSPGFFSSPRQFLRQVFPACLSFLYIQPGLSKCCHQSNNPFVRLDYRK